MTQCPHCGETSYYPQGPHRARPCPVIQREAEARLGLIEAQVAFARSAAGLPTGSGDRLRDTYLALVKARDSDHSNLGWEIWEDEAYAAFNAVAEHLGEPRWSPADGYRPGYRPGYQP